MGGSTITDVGICRRGEVAVIALSCSPDNGEMGLEEDMRKKWG